MSETSETSATTEQRAKFAAMADGSAAEWQIIAEETGKFETGLADRVLEHLRLLRGEHGGFAVDRYEHSLQSASLALRAGEDEEYVVCALLHDMGDNLGCYNHAELAAVMLQPFVSEANRWMVEKHGIFQGYYFFHHHGLDRNMREKYRGHPHFEATARFCHRYDQNAFDVGYDSLPLETFEPMLRRLLARPQRSIYLAD